MEQQKLIKYAKLIISQGLSLVKDDVLAIQADLEAAPLVRAVAEEAYKVGVKTVKTIWSDECVSRLAFKYESKECLGDIPDYEVASRDYIVDNNAARLAIISEDPDAMADVDADKLAAKIAARNKRFKRFYDATMSSKIRWCIVAYPGVAWANKIYPELPTEDAVNKLFDKIAMTVRLDKQDPLAEWQKHQEKLDRVSKFLNEGKFAAFKYKNSLGTDLTVGMPEDYIFMGGAECTPNGVPFTANMPTEEVFSAPHRLKVDGKVVASMPLVYNGKFINNFGFAFSGGKVVGYYAEEGLDVLKSIVETDEGTHYLGEIAMVDTNSPIYKSGILFYETLFDENASCHFALGEAYPTCVKGGGDIKEEGALLAKGINVSEEHVDFMIGTEDLCITGIKPDGTEVAIMQNGKFVI